MKKQIAANMMSMRDFQQGKRCAMRTERGDLFDAGRDWALCHCVSKDLKMSAGIAVAFKERFGGLEELRRQRINVGGVGVLRRDGRYIYYLVTKERYSDKPSLKSLEASLVALRERITADGVQRLAMPKLGCGLDGLSWNLVQASSTRRPWRSRSVGYTACPWPRWRSKLEPYQLQVPLMLNILFEL